MGPAGLKENPTKTNTLYCPYLYDDSYALFKIIIGNLLFIICRLQIYFLYIGSKWTQQGSGKSTSEHPPEKRTA